MPKITLTERSLLLTQHGWRECRGVSECCQVAGVDRHGKISFQSVEIERTLRHAPTIFFGTSLSCGWFSRESCIQDSRGIRLRLGQLVETGMIGDLQFESVAAEGRIRFDISQAEMIWDSLKTEAASFSESAIAVRLKSTEERATNVGVIVRIGQRSYWKADKASFVALLEEDSTDCFVKLIMAVFSNEAGFIEIGRDGCMTIMNFVGCLAQGRPTYRVSFDTLQHTLLVQVETEVRNQIPLGKGACVFVQSEGAIEWEMVWQTGTWNPFCNGLVSVP